VSIDSPAGPDGNTLADDDNVLNSDDEDNIPTLKSVYNYTFDVSVLTVFSSDVESLKQGIIYTRPNPAKAPHTILLIGETGVGKSSLLELIANVLHGNDVDHYDLDTLDHTNELHRSYNQTHTNSTYLYEFTSKNGVVVSATCLNAVTKHNHCQGSYPRHTWVGRHSQCSTR